MPGGVLPALQNDNLTCMVCGQAKLLDDANWIMAWVDSAEVGSTVQLRSVGPVVQLAVHGRQVSDLSLASIVSDVPPMWSRVLACRCKGNAVMQAWTNNININILDHHLLAAVIGRGRSANSPAGC